MRFLIREQEFERPVASGRFHFEQAGEPTGDYEAWRLTEIAGDYRFLRADLDCRGTGIHQGILYHMVINPSGTPERLKLRILSMENPLHADILFEADLLSVIGEQSGRRFEHELRTSGSYIFYFSSAIGLSLLLRNIMSEDLVSAVFFDVDRAELRFEKAIRIQKYPGEIIEVGQRLVDARPFSIARPGKNVRIWLDPYDLPVNIDFGEGLTAIDTQFMRYPIQAST